MRCTKCKGLMVIDHLVDIRESTIPMWMVGWRCVACGNIVDPLILRHRMIQDVGTQQLLTTQASAPTCRKTIKVAA
jgi:hypothetical protein